MQFNEYQNRPERQTHLRLQIQYLVLNWTRMDKSHECVYLALCVVKFPNEINSIYNVHGSNGLDEYPNGHS